MYKWIIEKLKNVKKECMNALMNKQIKINKRMNGWMGERIKGWMIALKKE